MQGVTRQKEDCLELANKHGYSVSEVYTDNDISAYRGAVRPAYLRMLNELADKQPAVIIAWHTDRLHRHPQELEEYIEATERQGVNTLTVKAGELDLSTPSGRAVARTLGAWARFESEHKSERITRKKLQLAKEGRYVGGPVPFGYDRLPDKTLVLSPEEAPHVAEAFQRFLNGASLGSLVRLFNERNLATRRKLEWNSTAMRNMLTRATYAGKAIYRGEVIGEGMQPAIITEADWLAAKRILEAPGRRTNHESRVKHLLSGILLCSKCGNPLKSSSRSTTSPNKQREYYKCVTRGDGHSFQTAEPVDKLVKELVIGRLSDDKLRGELAAPTNPDRARTLQTNLIQYRNRLEQAAQSFADGLIDAAQLATITGSLRTDVTKASNELATLSAGSAVPPVEAGDIKLWWDGAQIETRRAVINALMTLTVLPVRISAPRRFDPRRIEVVWKV